MRFARTTARLASTLAARRQVRSLVGRSRHGLPTVLAQPLSRVVLRPLPQLLHAVLLSTPTAASANAVAEELSDMYAEAKDLITDAEDGRGTVYFEEDLADAREAIEAIRPGGWQLFQRRRWRQLLRRRWRRQQAGWLWSSGV